MALSELLEKEIRKCNKEKQLEGTYKSHEARRNGSVQMDKRQNNSFTHTRQQISKETGVSTGNTELNN